MKREMSQNFLKATMYHKRKIDQSEQRVMFVICDDDEYKSKTKVDYQTCASLSLFPYRSTPPEWEKIGSFTQVSRASLMPFCRRSYIYIHSQQEQEQEEQQLPVVVTFRTYLKMSIRQHINVSNGDITDWLIPRHTCPTFGHNHTNMKLSNALQSTHPPTFQPAKRQSIQNKFVGLLFSIRSAINNWIFKKTHSPATKSLLYSIWDGKLYERPGKFCVTFFLCRPGRLKLWSTIYPSMNEWMMKID